MDIVTLCFLCFIGSVIIGVFTAIVISYLFS